MTSFEERCEREDEEDRLASVTHRIEHDRWMTDPRDVDYLAPEVRWCRVCAKLDSEHIR